MALRAAAVSVAPRLLTAVDAVPASSVSSRDGDESVQATAVTRPPARDGVRVLFERRVAVLLGMPLDVIDMAGAEARIRTAALRCERCVLSTPNLNFAVMSLGDPAFRDAIVDSDLNVPDGMPLVWVARLLGVPIRERVSGSGLLERMRGAGPAEQVSVYFFGGPDGAAEAAAERLNAQPSGLVCKGWESPGFRTIEALSTPESLARINASGSDFLVVSLGAQKGQAWIERNRAALSVPVVSHLGAALNFVAGAVRRAPPWVQRVGLEWLWRIKEEPALWRRYARDGLAFLRILATRVLPLAWTLRAARPQRSELDAATVAVDESGDAVVVGLSGAWTGENLRPVRDAFVRAAGSGRDVRVDLGEVSYADPEFIGLLVLLQGHQRRQCRGFDCAPVPARVLNVMRGCCAEFLLQGTPARQAGVSPR